jgi:hypothetical protein
MHDTGGGAASTSAAQFQWEYIWVKDRRPYYNIYPSIAEMLLRIDIAKVRFNSIQPPSGYKAIIVNLPPGNKLVNGTRDAQHLLISVGVSRFADNDKQVVAFGLNYGETIMGLPGWDMQFMSDGVLGNDGTVADMLNLVMQRSEATAQFITEMGYTVLDAETQSKIIKLGTALCLLGDDSDLLLAEVLSKDVVKLRDDNRNQLAKKARQRGVIGWTVGKEVSRIPGERRPHYALYHTGPGRKIDRILLRKGCVVNRSVMEKLPEGFQDDMLVPKE